MKRIFIYAPALLMLISCAPSTQEKEQGGSQKEVSDKKTTQEAFAPSPDEETSGAETPRLFTADTTVRLNGATYQLTLTVDFEKFDYTDNNGLFVIKNLNDGSEAVQDSLTSMDPVIRLEDYNGDGVPDILVYCCSGSRANEMYHLYITGRKSNQFIRIQGFEEHPNTTIDDNNIITSLVLSGENYYSFYRINPKYKLVKLGNTVPSDLSDEAEKNVQQEYERILKKYKRPR